MLTHKTVVKNQQIIIKPVAEISLTASRWAFGAAGLSLALVAALHFIKPEFEPSWHLVSEYAIGDHGWVMKLAFMCWALSCLALYAAVRSQVITKGGRIGTVLLFIVGIAIIMAGVFVIDPPSSGKDELTTHGNLHGLASMIGVPGQAIAAILVSISLSRNPHWAPAKRALLWTMHFTWISLVLLFSSVFIMLGKTQGKFGPDTLVGWPNRILVVAYCLWLMTVAWHAIRLNKERPKTY